MNKLSSKITIFVFAALLLGGFPNFVMQEAHATPGTITTGATAGDSTATTNIVITFTGNGIFAEDGAGTFNKSSLFSVAGNTVTTANIDGYASDTCNAGTGDTSVTLVLGTALATDATPDVTFTNDGTVGICDSNASNNDEPNIVSGTVTERDGLSPTLSSASVTSTTTIDVTFSEDVDGATVVAGDFTVTNPTRTISGVSTSGSTVTLTLSTELTSEDSPTITVVGTSSGIDDTSALDNTITSGSVTASTTLSASGGGSGCKDCEEPTLGVLSSGQRVVEDGFTYNGHSVDVERFFTPYPLITAQVGKQNTAQFKIYENRGPDNIAHFSFAFGLGKGEIISQSQAMIEVDFARDRTQTVTITDPQNALDNVSVTTDKVACNGGPTQCLEITIKHMFREPLDFDIVGTDVWDYSRQSWQNYYNHGIEVVGPSMNPPDEFDGIDKGYIYHLTETSKTTAVDEFGDTWTFQYGTWNKDFIKQERIQDGEKMVFDRMHSDFAYYKNTQAEFALSELLELCPLCIEKHENFEESFSYSYPNTINKLDDPKIQNKLKFEANKAQRILDMLLDPYYLYRDN